MTSTNSALMKNGATKQLDAVIVGAGFAGVYMLYRLKELGLSVQLYDRAGDVGGTWYWNRYPGARCDVESFLYSYSFSTELADEWTWSERYATQPEIMRYLGFVADKFHLRGNMQFDTNVTAAHFDENRNIWAVKTDRGDSVEAKFCIMATGCLSDGIVPQIKGIGDFEGEILRTSAWPHQGIDLAGKRVGIIGTGSSAIQATPLIAAQAAHLTVFQRTPNFSVPAQNTPHRPEDQKAYRETFTELRAKARRGEVLGAGDLSLPENERAPCAEPALSMQQDRRDAVYARRWAHGGGQFVLAFPDVMVDENVNETASAFVRAKIDEIVRDKKVADALKPYGYPLGSKRVCVDTGYYAMFNRDNVTLADIKKSPIEKITAEGIQTQDEFYPLDVLIFSTGFDAMTGSLLKIDIRGRNNLPLKKKWEDGARAFLGIAVSDFPNLFLITGPGSPSVLSNMVISIEQHVEWIGDYIATARKRRFATIEALPAIEAAWMKNVFQVADATLFNRGNSWYRGANVPGKPQSFPIYLGGVGKFREICDTIAAHNYAGFAVNGGDAPTPASTDAAELWEHLQMAGTGWVP